MLLLYYVVQVVDLEGIEGLALGQLLEETNDTVCSAVWKAIIHSATNPRNCGRLTTTTISEIQLFRNYFSLRRRPSEIVLFQRAETCLKLFRNYFGGWAQLSNIFQHV